MYRNLGRLLILIFLLSGCASVYSQKSRQAYQAGPEIKQAEDIVISAPLKRLPEYEKLTYEVRWLGIPVGEITASIKGIEKINGRDAYVLEALVRTNRFCSAIYRVQDRFVSYMDAQNLHTLRHEVYRRDGRYKKDAITDFDQVNHQANFRNLLDKSKKVFDIPEGVQDTLSASYYFRLLPLEVGRDIEYAVCNNEKNYQLFARVQSKGFIRLARLGEKEVFFIQPYVKLNEEEVKKGRVSGYFTCDEKRIPLLAIVEGPIFTKVTVALNKIESR